MYCNDWTALQWAAWKGQPRTVYRLLDTPSPISPPNPSPLFLALSRWGYSPWHQKMIRALWARHPNPAQVRWGDMVWGGSLTLLDLCIEKDLPHLMSLCVQVGLQPTERSWNMALHHKHERPLQELVHYFPPSAHLPPSNSIVARANALWKARELEESTPLAPGEASERRL